MKNPSVAKMAKMAGDSRSAAKFNAGLRKASAEGKLDNNPKFKEAVDSSPMKLKGPGQIRKDRAAGLAEAKELKKAAKGLKKHTKRKARGERKEFRKYAKEVNQQNRPARGKGLNPDPKTAGQRLKSAMKKEHIKPGDHTTHGNPSKYTTSSGKSVDSANIDEGNLSTVMDSPSGKKYVVVQEDTEKFKAGTKLYINE